MAKAKTVNPAFASCLDLHKQWWEKNHPYKWYMTPRAGKALNEILDKLSGSYEIVKGVLPTVQELINSFKLVFDMYEYWGFWKGKLFELWDINTQLYKLLEEIKKNNGKSNTTGKPTGSENPASKTNERAYIAMQEYRNKRMATGDKH